MKIFCCCKVRIGPYITGYDEVLKKTITFQGSKEVFKLSTKSSVRGYDSVGSSLERISLKKRLWPLMTFFHGVFCGE